jgi:hypothetical protein
MTGETPDLIREVSGHLQFNLDAYGKVWTGEDEDTAFICRPLLKEIERLREALQSIRTYAHAPHNTDFAASCGACTIDACIGCLIEGTACEALEAGGDS